MNDQSATAMGNRSPAYPFIDLKRAVELTQKAFEYAKHSEGDIQGLYKYWGFKGENGSSKKILAALKYYGLLDQAHGSTTVKVSGRAKRILLDHSGSPERAKALVDAFLQPSMYKLCWDKWKMDMPHPDAMQSYLMFNHGFNHGTVGDFIDKYKRSLEYSNIAQAAKLDHEGEENERPQVAVGDTVQWESGGILQFSAPRKVRAMKEDGETVWVFVEGSETGIDLEEVALIEKAQEGALKPPAGKIPPKLPEEIMRRDEVTLAKDEREWLRGPLSKEAGYRIIVSGEVGPKEISKLIVLLQAQKAVLDDQNEDG